MRLYADDKAAFEVADEDVVLDPESTEGLGYGWTREWGKAKVWFRKHVEPKPKPAPAPAPADKPAESK